VDSRVPESIRKTLYADWFFEPTWLQMHYSNAGNNIGVTVGGNGTGKSLLDGWVAETLGVNKQGEPTLFNTSALNEHVFFDSASFIARANELMKMKRSETVGTQLILEEGQISLYSKEAFNTEVKNLSKMLMTIRSRRWGIYINIPSFGMLNRDVRSITNWLIHMKGKPKDYSYGTFYWVETNMITGEPYIKKPVFTKCVRSEDGIDMLSNLAYSILPFPKPSKKFLRPYGKLKEAHQKELYDKYGVNAVDGVEDKAKSPAKKSVEEMVIEVLSKPSEFLTRNKLSASKVATYFGMTVSTNPHRALMKALVNTYNFNK